MADLLDEFNSKEISVFKHDITQLIRVTIGVDKYYAQQHKKLDSYVKPYEKLIKDFNQKYKNLHLKLVKLSSNLKLRVFIKEKDVKTIFSSAAVKIIALKSIGAAGFGKADVTKSDQLAKELEKVKDKLYISYYHQEKGSDTIILEYDPKVKMIELIYDKEGIVNEESPEFKLAAFYAIKNFDPKIDLAKKSSDFGFVDLLSEDERKKWFDGFNTRLEE